MKGSAIQKKIRMISIIINSLIGIAYILFGIYLAKNKKHIPINLLGILIAISALYPYIILYDTFYNNHSNSSLKYEIMICRFLVVVSMYSTVKELIKVNVNLAKLLRKTKNKLSNLTK